MTANAGEIKSDRRANVRSIDAARLRRIADDLSSLGSHTQSRNVRERIFAAVGCLFDGAALAEREAVQ